MEKEKCHTKDVETERKQKTDFEEKSKKKDLGRKKGQKKGNGKGMDLSGGDEPSRGSKAENRREKRRGSLLWQHPEIPSTITEGAVLEVINIVINMSITIMVFINIITQSSIQRCPQMQWYHLKGCKKGVKSEKRGGPKLDSDPAEPRASSRGGGGLLCSNLCPTCF